jgi:hypothetical protein
LDDTRLAGIIFEYLAYFGYRANQHVFGHKGVLPDVLKQHALGDNLACMLRQQEQHLHHLGLDANRPVSALEGIETGMYKPIADLEISQHVPHPEFA